MLGPTVAYGIYLELGFNRDPHFQRVMPGAPQAGQTATLGRFNRDPHFQRVMLLQRWQSVAAYM